MGGLARTLLPLSANETDQIAQGGWREQRDGAFIDTLMIVRMWHGQIGPPPRRRQHHAVLESDQHPRNVVAPEDPTDATSLTAGQTLFRHDRESRPTKCNIWCSLSLGSRAS